MANRVWVLVVDGFELLDMAGPVQVLTVANQFGAAYDVTLVGTSPKVRSVQGVVVGCRPTLPETSAGDLVLIPGVHAQSRDTLGSLPVDWVRRSHDRGALLASICAGAFVLGSAGLLDGRQCTTHWSLTDALAAKRPRAVVSTDRLFVDDRGITTSAGVASGIDMALWLVERDHGPLMTAHVARELVVYMRRDGSHLQDSVYLDFRTHLSPMVHRAQDWLQKHFREHVGLDDVARAVGSSSRHLARAFKSATGVSPRVYQQLLRLELAASLMRDPELSVDAIARACGYGDARSFRRAWRAHAGVSPSQSRAKDL